MKKLGVIKWIAIVLAAAINIFIIVNACLPAGPSTEESNWIVEPIKNIINAIKPNTINETNIGNFSTIIRKLIGHFFLFLVSGILTTLSFKFLYYDLKKKIALSIIFSSISGLFLAFLTEFIQLFVPGRSGEMRDVLIDFSGYLLGAVFIYLIVFLKRKNSSSLENEK